MNIFLTAKLKKEEEFFKDFTPDMIQNKEEGKNLLSYSLANKDLQARYAISNFLIDSGCDVSVINDEGETLLHILLGQVKNLVPETTEVCKKLIDGGVDINTLDKKKRLALQYIINMKNTDKELAPLYNLWFATGEVCVNIKNNWGTSPLELASSIPYRNDILERMKKDGKECS